MSDSDACGACCTLVVFSAFSNWCNTLSWGSGGSGGGTAGCCGSCCNKSFDADAWDEQVQKDMEKTKDPNTALNTEPSPKDEMSTEGPSSK